MQYGVFDHMDRGTEPLAQQYQDRLALTEAYDRLGFRSYHLAEHHCTPLGMAPSPSLMMAAISQRTRRLRFGPMVYTMSMYHPLRLAEEICMLDQLSGGRLEVGVGRGISQFEVGYYGVDPAKAQQIYAEGLDVVRAYFRGGQVDHHGEFFRFAGAPVELQPFQRPHPPLWYGVATPEGTGWTSKNDMNVIMSGPAPAVRQITDTYREHWAAQGKPVERLPLLGVSRHVVVADTEAQALAAARPAYALWYARLMHLWDRHGARPTYIAYPDNFDDAQRAGYAIAGDAPTVRDWVREQAATAGLSYFVARLAFGDLTREASLRSAELFAQHLIGSQEETR